MLQNYRTITISGPIMVSDDNLFLDSTSGNIIATLPQAGPAAERVYRLFVINDSNTITISADGSELINGLGSIQISKVSGIYGKSILIQSTGTGWEVIQTSIPELPTDQIVIGSATGNKVESLSAAFTRLGLDLTGSEILTRLKTVDSNTSGLNSQYLGGQDGAFYLDYSNFNNTPTTITSTQASQISANNAKITNATHTGDVTGSTALTIGAAKVKAAMLNNDIISGRAALTAGILGSDEILISDAGIVKRADISVLQQYMQDNLSFVATGSGDGNDYVDTIGFSGGIVTLGRTGTLSNLTQSLDGRWALLGHQHQASDITNFQSNVSINSAVVLNTAKRSYPVGDENKLAGIAAGAQVNVQSDYNATSGDALILNKPVTITTAQANAITANTSKVSNVTHTGDVTGSTTLTIGAAKVQGAMLNNNAISARAALTSGLIATDELMVSDAGVLKRMDVSVLQAYMQSALNFQDSVETYATGLAFDTATGVFTVQRTNNVPNLTIDLDGRYSLLGHTHTFASLTSKPTTLSGYGITDAMTASAITTALAGKEPTFTKNTAFNKAFGTSSGQVAQGNDSRINNGQTAFGWGDHAQAGYITEAGDNYIDSLGFEPTTGTLTIGRNGSLPNITVSLNGRYALLSHTHTASQITDFSTAVAATSSVSANTAKRTYPSADETKLSGIEAGATADLTASEILTLLKSVDGLGSGLDADFVRGYELSASGGANKILRTGSNGYLYLNNWIQLANGTGITYPNGLHVHEQNGDFYSNAGFDSDDGYKIDGKSINWFRTLRNFTNGTLIATDIVASNTNGEPWLLELKGNGYGQGTVDIKAQGYIYSNSIINLSAQSTGKHTLTDLVAFELNGFLHFWFSRQGYWQGYDIHVDDTNSSGTRHNRVTGVTNVVKPTTQTKEVNLRSVMAVAWNNYNLTNNNQLTNGAGYLTSATETYSNVSELFASIGPNLTTGYLPQFNGTSFVDSSFIVLTGEIDNLIYGSQISADLRIISSTINYDTTGKLGGLTIQGNSGGKYYPNINLLDVDGGVAIGDIGGSLTFRSSDNSITPTGETAGFGSVAKIYTKYISTSGSADLYFSTLNTTTDSLQDVLRIRATNSGGLLNLMYPLAQNKPFLYTDVDGDVLGGTANTAFNKNFGTASGTVAQGNDSRINNGQTAFGWGNHASAGYITEAQDNQALTWTPSTSTLAISGGNSQVINTFGTSINIQGQSNDGSVGALKLGSNFGYIFYDAASTGETNRGIVFKENLSPQRGWLFRDLNDVQVARIGATGNISASNLQLNSLLSSEYLKTDVQGDLTAGTWASVNLSEFNNDEGFIPYQGGVVNGLPKITLDGNNKPQLSQSGFIDNGTNPIWSPLSGTGGTFWHSGNDGAGSGLDADLLDGINSTTFARKDQANTFTGIQTFLKAMNGSALSSGSHPTGEPSDFGTDIGFRLNNVFNNPNYPALYGGLISYNNPNNGYGYNWQLFSGLGSSNVGYVSANDDLYFRHARTGGVGWRDWVKIYHSGNLDISNFGLWTDDGDGTITRTSTVATEATNLATSKSLAAVSIAPLSISTWSTNFGSTSGQQQYIQATNSTGSGTKGLLLNPFGGNVGIGTTSPTYKLDSYGPIASRGSGVGNAAFVLQEVGNNPWHLQQFTGGAFSINYNGIGSANSHLIILETGNLGIGTTTPLHKLDVRGAISTRETLYFSRANGTVDDIANISWNTAENGLVFNNNNGGYFSWSRNILGELMRIHTNGNVGIGTTNPLAKLHVNGTGYFQGNVGVNTAWSSNTLSSNSIYAQNGTDGFGFGVGLGVSTWWAWSNTNGLNRMMDVDNNGTYITLRTVDSERVRITSSGNIGIGTTTPISILELKGGDLSFKDESTTVVANQVLRGIDFYTSDPSFSNSAINKIAKIRPISQSSVGQAFGLGFYTSAVDTDAALNMLIDEAGNVGIGNTTPKVKLDVNLGEVRAADFQLTYNTGTSFSGIRRTGAATEYYNSVTGTPTNIIHTWSGQSAPNLMTITQGGNVGIGTTNPTSKLTVAGGNIQIGNNYSIYGTRVAGSPVGLLKIDASDKTQIGSSTSATAITISGTNVGIGTTAPTEKLTVWGTIHAYPDPAYSQSVIAFHASNTNPTDRYFSGIRHQNGSGTMYYGGGAVLHNHIDMGSTGGFNVRTNTWNGSSYDTTIPFYIQASTGNVGIGTITPARLLSLSSATTANLQLTTSTSGATTTDGFQIKHFSSGATQLWQYENNYLAIATNNLERMRITSTGNVGIGTTAPTEKLSVTGNVIIQGSDDNKNALLVKKNDNDEYTGYIENLGGNGKALQLKATGTGGTILDLVGTSGTTLKFKNKISTITTATKVLVKDPTTDVVSEQVIPIQDKGFYTPAVTSDAPATISQVYGIYTRYEDVVDVNVTFRFTTSLNGSDHVISIGLPIGTDLLIPQDVIGFGSAVDISAAAGNHTQGQTHLALGIPSTDKAALYLEAQSTGEHYVNVNFKYRIR